MSVNGMLVADSDMHVMEPGNLWQRYMDPSWGPLAPVGLEDTDRDMRVRLKSVVQRSIVRHTRRDVPDSQTLRRSSATAASGPAAGRPSGPRAGSAAAGTSWTSISPGCPEAGLCIRNLNERPLHHRSFSRLSIRLRTGRCRTRNRHVAPRGHVATGCFYVD